MSASTVLFESNVIGPNAEALPSHTKCGQLSAVYSSCYITPRDTRGCSCSCRCYTESYIIGTSDTCSNVSTVYCRTTPIRHDGIKLHAHKTGRHCIRKRRADSVAAMAAAVEVGIVCTIAPVELYSAPQTRPMVNVPNPPDSPT